MYKLYIYICLSFIALHSDAQDEQAKTQAEKTADSIMDLFSSSRDINPRFETGFDSIALEKAEERYMDDFLKLQRDPVKEKRHKIFLYAGAGLVMLAVLFIGFKRRRNRE